MHDKTISTAAQPVFKKCPGCGYSLRGLPATHACPECGLRFDECCELYRATNSRQTLVLLMPLLVGGFFGLKNFRDVLNFTTASAWEKVGVVFSVGCLFFAGIWGWFFVNRYRRGVEVAVTSNGLIVRLPEFDGKLIPWDALGGASMKPLSEGKPQIAQVFFKDKRRPMTIGDVANVFPTRAHVERFVEQVKDRIEAARSDDAITGPG